MKKRIANLSHGLTCLLFALFAGLYFYQIYVIDEEWVMGFYGAYFGYVYLALKVTCLLLGLFLSLAVFVLIREQKTFNQHSESSLILPIFLIVLIVSALLFVELKVVGLIGLSEITVIRLLIAIMVSGIITYIFNRQTLKAKTSRRVMMNPKLNIDY